MKEIDFSSIWIHQGSKSNGFEELVCQLANCSKPENTGAFIRKDGSGGDAGVECYWKFKDGSEHGWQAKFFLKPLGPTQWKQISSSVETALNKHPHLSKYYICLPRNRTDRRQLNKTGNPVASELVRWNEHVEKWKQIASEKSMSVEFEFWGAHEITLMLQRDSDDFSAIRRSWFDTTRYMPSGLPQQHFPTGIIDQIIESQVEKLRKSMFFKEFKGVDESLVLARKLTDGDFSCGSDGVKLRALIWCIRLLSHCRLDKANLYYKIAKDLGTCSEIAMAAAFISSGKGAKEAALKELASVSSPTSRSAALMIVVHHDGPREAIDWSKKAGIDCTNLDSDGKYVLLHCLLELGDLRSANQCVSLFTENDLSHTPALHYIVAKIHLLNTVPDELQAVILSEQMLLNPPDFPLASNGAAIDVRRRAQSHYFQASRAARQLGLSRAATTADEYAIWLEIRDPDKSDQGRKRLESRLRDPNTALGLVRLALQFDLELDFEKVEQEIERQIALNGGTSPPEATFARFALALKQHTPEDKANYIDRHYDDFVAHFARESLQALQIELLSAAGLLDRANGIFDTLIQAGLSSEEESRLRGIIAEAEGTDPVEIRIRQFEKTGSLRDLTALIAELQYRNDWDRICKFGEIQFERTGALRDAERFATALHFSNQNDQLAKFLASNMTLLTQSTKLRQLHCWTLYNDGALLEARSELVKLSDCSDDPIYRNLQINLAISMGDLNSVLGFVANECQEKERRNAPELLGTAQLALRLDSVYQAKELLSAAVKRGNDDPKVLATAYHIATSAGWENQEVSQWIQKAADLSGDDGPIQKFTLREFLDRKPEWERRDSEISRRLMCGDLPMFLAAQLRNMSLGSMMVYAALGNLGESDPRRRDVIPAYSGDRRPTPLETVRHIGIDATALLTLSFLNVLDEALDAFGTVHIPHSTLGWLFEEKQRLTFHQPSRINEARRILDWLADGTLDKLSPSSVPDSDLSDQVGEELAQFIAEAEMARESDDSQRIVVKPAPVYRISSLLEEEADLTSHEGVLSSCQSIIDTLQKKGKITTDEAERAGAFLRLQERSWPNQPPITDGAILYLDDLAVRYFLHLGVLRKLSAAGFTLIISERVVSDANQFISYERIAGEAKNHIERIRSALNARIESGKIKVSRRTNSAREAEDQAIFEHPAAGVMSLASQCDAIIVDDRSLNQHTNFVDNDVKTPIVSTLDLLDVSAAGGVITERARSEYRTRLRQAGYLFVPVTEDELAQHLDASPVENGRVNETAKLRAIRENILQVRMGTWLQLPKEEYWLQTMLGVSHRVLAGMWRANADFEQVRARSDWILSLIDLRGWAHAFSKEVGDNIVRTGSKGTILSILAPPSAQPQEVKDEYRRWVEERVLARIKEQNPELYIDLVEWYRSGIEELVSMHTKESEDK